MFTKVINYITRPLKNIKLLPILYLRPVYELFHLIFHNTELKIRIKLYSVIVLLSSRFGTRDLCGCSLWLVTILSLDAFSWLSKVRTLKSLDTINFIDNYRSNIIHRVKLKWIIMKFVSKRHENFPVVNFLFVFDLCSIFSSVPIVIDQL